MAHGLSGSRRTKMAEFEFAGATFRGGKMMIVLTALSTLGGGLWAGFEFYKDYMDMKEIVQNIDTTEIENQNTLLLQRMDEQMVRIEEAIEYTRDIKSGLRDDILGIEKQVDRTEDNMNELENDVRQMIQNAEERFENKRDALQNDYDQAKDRLQTNTANELKELEDRLTKKLQRALDNPLAN